MALYRILSLDGGGLRGLLTAVLLSRLERHQPGWLKRVDLIAGTSTGGVLALGLAAGLSPDELIALYTQHAGDVFFDTALDDVRDAGNLLGAEYSARGFKQLLRTRFGDRCLRDLPKHVLIPTFDLDNEAFDPGQFRTWKPKFFHNFAGPDSDGPERIVDVALRTTAAPTYFPVYQGYVDGGVVANNPSMCALAQALNFASLPGAKGSRPVSLDQIVMLSLGTGRQSEYVQARNADWGLAAWSRYLVGIMINGSVDVAAYQAERLLGERHHRLSPILPEPIALDAVDKIELLRTIAGRVDLDATARWLSAHWH
jgi:patatin-like phospholipase/acyl hydrolase